MKYLAVSALAICSILAAPALAQSTAQFTASEADVIAPQLDNGCVLGEAAQSATGEQKIAYCDAAIANVVALGAKGGSPAHQAGLAYLRGAFEFTRAGAFLTIDHVRSQRVCSAVEQGYATLASIDARLFDAPMAQALDTSRTAMSNGAASCRKDFGAPANAPALVGP